MLCYSTGNVKSNKVDESPRAIAAIAENRSTYFFSLAVLWPALPSGRIDVESGGGIEVTASDAPASPSSEVCARIFGRAPFSPMVRCLMCCDSYY